MRRGDRTAPPRAGWLALFVAISIAPVEATPVPEAPFDPAVMAEWACYPAFERAGGQGVGACGCAWPGACGDRAPAGCYCDGRCAAEGDCCPDAGLCAEDPS